MKLKMRWMVFAGCMATVVLQASAQEAWTLEQCIRYACDNNIRLKQQEMEVEYAENTLLQSKINRYPAVNASSSYNQAKGRVWDNTSASFVEGSTVKSLSGTISSSVTIFNGFQQRNTIERNRFSLMVSIQNVEKLKNDLSVNIASFYLQIIYAQEQLAVAENQLALTLLQIKRTEALVKAGSVPEGELLDIQSQAAREELQIVIARNTLELAKLDLTQLLDLKSAANFQVVVPDFSGIMISEITHSVNDVYGTAETVMPEVKAAGYSVAEADKTLSIAKGARSPRLSISGGMNTAYSNVYSNNWDLSLWEQISQNYNMSFGVNLSIPIFNGWQVNTGIKNARLNLQNYQYQLQLVKNNLYKEIQQAYADAAAALQKYTASAKAVTSLEEAFRYTEQRYEVGIMNFVDYSTAKTRLSSAQSDLLQAKFEYIFKTKILDFYNGRPITL